MKILETEASNASKFTLKVELPIQLDEEVAAEYLKTLLTEALCEVGCPPFKVEAWFNRD